MLTVVAAIYKMVGEQVVLPEDEATPALRVEKLFAMMDTNGDGYLSMEEFTEGSKRDETILSSMNLYGGLV